MFGNGMDHTPTPSQTDRRIPVTDRDARNSSSGFVSMDTEENIASPTISRQVKVREWRKEKTALCCHFYSDRLLKNKSIVYFCRFRDSVHCKVYTFYPSKFQAENSLLF